MPRSRSTPEPKRPNTEFIVGLYLMNHGKASASRPYLERCAQVARRLRMDAPIASDAFRGRKETKVKEAEGRPSVDLGVSVRDNHSCQI